MCVRNVDVHVSCSSHVNAQLAAFFIDPRAKGSTEVVCIFSFYTYTLTLVFGEGKNHSFVSPGLSFSCST